jgi:hypothetical protein
MNQTPQEPVKYLFRESPPDEIIHDILKSLNFTSIKDPKIFHKTDIPLPQFEEWLPILEPYYYPCKAKLFLRRFTHDKAVTVLRHILRTQGYKLQAYEKVVQGVKQTMYQIQQEVWKVEDLSGSLHVEFT